MNLMDVMMSKRNGSAVRKAYASIERQIFFFECVDLVQEGFRI